MNIIQKINTGIRKAMVSTNKILINNNEENKISYLQPTDFFVNVDNF
ncbi:hypothetical protein GF327_05805 [Candidatus Woesearchaeota archaeon]|nr:hypothetical protein [Candidatus Woesearchaeota archaeon]